LGPRANIPQYLARNLSALAGRLAVEAVERSLAGRASGVMWLLGGATMTLPALLPGAAASQRPLELAIAAAAAAWGVASIFAIDWERARPLLVQASSAASLPTIALAVAAGGGSRSAAWIYLFWLGGFAAYFYERRVAAAYLLASVLVLALPFAYDHRAVHDGFTAELATGAAGLLALGSAIIAGKALLVRLRARAELLAAEQGALRRIATAVVSGESAAGIYELVAVEVAAMAGGGAAGILRLGRDGTTTVMGSWSDREGGRYAPGMVVPIRPGGDIEAALATGRPVRIDAHPPDSPVARLGYRASIVAPITVAGEIWGILAVAADATVLGQDDEQRLMAFGDLLATAIRSLDDRATLAAQASSDPLTGLANHRTLHEHLQLQTAAAARRHRSVAVAVLDVDHFKQINDIGGHELGDETLVRVADCLRALARPQDTLSRAGGDEFTWIQPGVTREQALEVVQRARALIETTVSKPYRVTVSAGICDTSFTTDPAELIRLADGALYWSKAHGRDQCQIYDPAVVDELSAQQRAERLERSHALVGLRALARAIDAKDPATREHSERVASLVEMLARAAGWSAERALALSEAALVHDVGKIGVPDTLLRKPGRLTPAERAEINEHAELSARIVEGVLSDEQVDWIRTHHERPDGRGYPRGLCAAEIPEGGLLLAAADAFDVMTVGRTYRARRSIAEAIEECRGLVGAQFGAVAVDALQALDEAAELSVDMTAAYLTALHAA
jgi:diguanylate cyclase (GGDEF)-like protein